MTNKRKLYLVVATLLACSNVAQAIECIDGKLVDVKGSVQTQNISSVYQVGLINLGLLDNTTVVYANSGSIAGTVTNQNANSITLTHKIDFNPSGTDSIDTQGDHAILLMPPLKYDSNGSACAFNVVESITNFEGTGFFVGANGYIVATGTVDFCPADVTADQASGAPDNTFDLTGQLCIKNN